MRYNLAHEAHRARNIRRRSITLREITAPTTEATNLYLACYKPVIDLWTAAAAQIAQEYERTLAAMTTDAPADVQGEIDRAASTFDRLVLTLTPSLRNWALRIEAIVRRKWTRQVFSATSVDLTTRLGPADVAEPLEAIIARNVALVKDVSAQIQSRISDSVFRGLTNRMPARDVAKEISNAIGMGRDRAIRVASDQLSKAAGTLAEERQRQAGIEKVVWVHSAKLHPRADHLSWDGKLFWLDTKKSVDGEITVAPGNWASQPPFCGCRTRAYLDFSDE
jgi:uncharacterized protein with gpF-like domain